MDEPDRSALEVPAGGPAAIDERTAWLARLPRPPFVDPGSATTAPRFAALSPRVGVLIAAAVVIGIVLWMARDAVRPFIVGLLFVYLLDPPVRWLTRHGLRRSLSILLVYAVSIVLIIEFLNVTLTPLVDEIVRFVQDFPRLTEQLQAQLARLSDCTPACRSRPPCGIGSIRCSRASARAAGPGPS